MIDLPSRDPHQLDGTAEERGAVNIHMLSSAPFTGLTCLVGLVRPYLHTFLYLSTAILHLS